MLTIISAALEDVTVNIINIGTAPNNPKAVEFIAKPILAESNSDFSAGGAFATALKAAIKPITVPSNPSRVENICK